MRTRNWSIRAKIISLLLIPLVALVAMWALATYITLGPGLELLSGQANLDSVARPAGVMLAELQTERKLSLAYLAGGRKDSRVLVQQRTRTDAAIVDFRRLAGGPDVENTSRDLTRTRVQELFTALDGLSTLRGGVDRGDIDRFGALRQYTGVVDGIYRVYGSMVNSSDAALSRESKALVSLAQGRELLAQEDALLAGAFATGAFTSAELSQMVQVIGAQRYTFAQTLPDLPRGDQDDFAQVAASADFTGLVSMENKLITDARSGSAVPISAGTWNAAYANVAQKLRDFELRAADRLVERSTPAAIAVFLRIGVAGLLGLVAVIVTIVATVRIGRSLIKRLAGLRQAALEMSIDRLPRVMERLRQGEDVDVAHEAPPLPYGRDEVGQVGHAFNELQRAAVNSAVEEANVRRGLNEVFLNIARRSQTLLHRQLSILDRMERRAEDPMELEDLFRIDHLATRMRRHAEDLVILAGSAPGRGWRNPVPIVDVLRGAVSEVEDYARVSIRPLPEVAIVGRAVGDLIHLLAELIENATSFSPPHTRVNIGGENVSHGFAVEIEDRGLGMTPEALAEANARLADPPNFDPTNSAQLGLFVVARLAARHGIRVQLRPSPYGGITAVALVPEELVVQGPVPREAIAATPYPGNGANGSSRPTLYRELSTAQRPAIAPPPSAGAFTATPLPPRHARQEVIEAPPSAGPDGLPRRVRQTNMAPQLRDEAPPTAPGSVAPGPLSRTEGSDTPPPGSRTPEQLRAMMTSFQAGLTRGRADADAGDDQPERDPR